MMRKFPSIKCIAVFFTLVISAAASAEGWERPRTTRRYLHPPLAERMFVLWNDAKISFSEVGHNLDWLSRRYTNEVADACWFLHGDNDKLFDFKTARNLIPADGTPIHGLEWDYDGAVVTIETCCDCSRASTCHGRFAVKNTGAKVFRDRYAMRFRHGPEWVLLGGNRFFWAPDFYKPYESLPETWNGLPVDWSFSDGILSSSGGRFAAINPMPSGAAWDEKNGELVFWVVLQPGESLAFDFALGIGEPVKPDFAKVRKNTAEWWGRELNKIRRLPAKVAKDADKVRLVRNLTVQMLQCFCRPVGKDYVLPRQGGLQRWVWPWDNMEALTALSMIGDFGEYVEGAVSFYFDVYGNVYDGRDKGRFGPFGIDWDCNTANVLGIFGRCCLETGNAAMWSRYRKRALDGFRWVMRHRVQPEDSATGLVVGLFPPGRSSDYEGQAQVWGFTDGENIRGLSFYLDAAEYFHDPSLAEIQAGVKDYVSVYADVVSRMKRDCAGKQELYLPLTLDGTDGARLHKGYPRQYEGVVSFLGLRFGFLDSEDVMRIWRSSCGKGRVSTEHGLTGNLPPYDDLESRHFWYTTYTDSLWHRVFRRIGRHDIADRILSGTIRFSMTEECYLGERYRDDNPWYLPWSPNASGSGRIIQMLLEDR